MKNTQVVIYALTIFWGLSLTWIAAFFWWKDKFPSIEGFKGFVELINTKGGNILVLLFFSLLGCFASIRMLYYLIQLSVDGKLQQDNSFALLAISFVTNTLTGAFIGAMLKTMTGDITFQPPKEDTNAKS